jgi:hypothetical protein
MKLLVMTDFENTQNWAKYSWTRSVQVYGAVHLATINFVQTVFHTQK